jgi:thiol-disulfide isomerase/thioredoxin
MRRWLAFAVVVGACLAGSMWADDKKPAGESPLATAKKEFDAALKEKQAEMRKAPPDFQKELAQEIREFTVIETDKLFELAEQEPATAAAFDIFADLTVTALDKDKARKARDLIAAHHLDQPHVKKVLLGFAAGTDPKAEGLLKIVLEKNKDADCQGYAHLALGLLAKQKVKQSGGREKADLVKAAIEHFTAVKTKYAAVKAGEETIGKQAEAHLAELKLADQLQVGKAVPDLTGEDLDGQPLKLSDFTGKVVMLSFWATWCPPCMGLVPHEQKLVEKMKDKPFALVGVNGDDELTAAVRKVIADKKITWRSFQDRQKGQTAISKAWEVDTWPTIYVIDHKGTIRHIQTGAQEIEKVDELISKLVAEAEKK